MNVLMTADGVGGVWRYALELADALAPRGVRIALATMGPPLQDEQRAEAAASRLESLHESRYALEWMEDAWDDVEAAGAWLLALADETDADLVHLNGFAHATIPWRRPTVVVAHSDVLSWWEAVRREPAPPEWERYRSAVEDGLRAADLVVAPTRATLDALERHYAFPGERVVVPNGLRAVPTRPKEAYVAAAGRFWDEAKNVEALRRVEPHLAWPLRYDRDGRWLARHELEDLIARAAVFAAPARYEPFGLSILTAASAGCALVLGQIDSLREVWGDAALYVDPDDDEALRATLQSLIGDARLREALGRRARARAARYTPERMASAYLALYARIAANATAVR